MVSVPGVGQNATTNRGAKSQTTLDHEAFLRLFVEQLKNQDPTAPLDATQSLAQLATFSQVEQSVATNEKLDSLLTAQWLSLDALLTAQSLSQANSLIGRTLTSADGTVSGEVVSVQVAEDGTHATLADGQTVLVGMGVTVS
ncbi:flagellar hook capping FlgD N-terminal domain-containing protein [Pseudochelatococcus sp. B33]